MDNIRTYADDLLEFFHQRYKLKNKPTIIFAKDQKHVWTFSSYDSEAAVFSDRNCFPRSIIKKMERITL